MSTMMPSEAALNLSFLELIQTLNDKLVSDCTRVRAIHLPHGVTTLKNEASASLPMHLNPRSDLTVDPSDRISREQYTPNLGAYSLVEEPIATTKLVAPGDPFPYRPIPLQRICKGHYADNSNDPRMSVLAQFYYLDSQELDSYIQRADWRDKVKPGAIQGGSSGVVGRRPSGNCSRVLRPDDTLFSKHPDPGSPSFLRRGYHNTPERPPLNAKSLVTGTPWKHGGSCF